MRGELRTKLELAITEAFDSDSVKPEDLNDEVWDIVSGFVTDVEDQFNDIKNHLDDDTLREIGKVSDAFDIAEDYSDKLY